MAKRIFNNLLFSFLFVNAFGQGHADSLASVRQEPVGMTVEEFRAATCISHKMVLVNFKADWCVVCKKQKPIIDEIRTEKQKTVVVMVIDMEKNPLIAEYFEVDGLPVTILYRDGVIIWDRMGLLSKKEITDVIKLFE